MQIKAVLFDIEGTLIDSNDSHVAVWDQVFRVHGFLFNLADIHDQFGKGGDVLVTLLIPNADETTTKTLSDLHGDIFKESYLAKMQPFPQPRELLVRASEMGQKVAFASSASQSDLDRYLDILDAREIVSATISFDNVESSKPEPDIFAAALKKIGSRRLTMMWWAIRLLTWRRRLSAGLRRSLCAPGNFRRDPPRSRCRRAVRRCRCASGRLRQLAAGSVVARNASKQTAERKIA